MKILKSKAMAILIAVLLTFSIVDSFAQFQTVKAGSASIETYAFVNAAPNPAGVGQTVNIGMWLAMPPPTASGALGDRWQNFKVTVTMPDGTTTSLGPFTSDDTGGAHADFTPSQTGNYTIFFSFPGQELAGTNPSGLGTAYVGDYFEPSNATTDLTVQQSAIPYIPQTPLPTSYWSRPIESMNSLWSTLGGNWFGFGTLPFANTGTYNITGNYNPYTTAPTTAHVMWTRPVAFGGLIGGEFGGSDTSNFYATSQYEPKFAPIIMNGILYYTSYTTTCTAPEGWNAVNLQTGQTIWTKNTTDVLRCGQILNYISPNQYGGLAYLWSNPFIANVAAGTGPNVNSATWNMYDAMTGNYILSIVNGSSMTLTEDSNGDLIGYYTNVTHAVPSNPYSPVVGETLNMWNSTQAILYPRGFTPGVTVSNWMWRPVVGSQIDFNAGIVWTVDLPLELSGVPLPTSLAINTVNSGVVLLQAEITTDVAGFFNNGFAVQAGYDANSGSQLWITNRTLAAFTRDQLSGAGGGMFFMINADSGTLTAYSLNTGNVAWGPIYFKGDNGIFPVPDPYDSSGGYVTLPADGVLYIYGFGGDIWSVDMATGAINWYTSTNTLSGYAGSDTPYGVWPLWIFSSESIANGVLFIGEGHEYSPPLFRGASQLAINITNGELVWSITSFDVSNPMTLSDGIGVVLNAYDNQIYAYGMGPSKTTINVPAVGVTTAEPVTISGTVTDISAGSQQHTVAANFPNGLPCVSDASMSQFMEAVYMQQSMPNNITGVPVAISVVDSNGNSYEIGTATSDASGTYSLTWTPNIPGNFTVTAHFAGTQSYYGSSAVAHFYAGDATAATTTPAPLTANNATTTDIMIGVTAIIVAIAVATIVIALIFRRRA